MEDRLEKLKKKKEQLSARIQQIEAREKSKQRKQDTRRKILLGSLLQHWMEEDESIRGRVEQNLPTFLVRKIDRELFDLPPLPATKDEDG